MAHARYCRGRSRGRITVGHALVAELADALDLGSSVLRRGGSSPPERTAMSRLIVPTVGRDFVARPRRAHWGCVALFWSRSPLSS